MATETGPAVLASPIREARSVRPGRSGGAIDRRRASGGAGDGQARALPGTWGVAGAGALAALLGGAWFVGEGLHVSQGDALAHLLIARRLWDSAAPGLGQLGTTWLPAPHLLLAPFTVALDAWASGLAGWLLGIACLAVTAAAIWRLTARLEFCIPARLVAVAAVLVNTTLAYLFTTALTEPVLIAAIACCLAGLAHWVRAGLSPGELALFAGVPAAVATMSRYEGWAMAAAAGVVVALVSARRTRSARTVARDVAAVAALPVLAVAWWLAVNHVIYADPFAFLSGPYSAASLQQPMQDAGLMPTTGNLGLSLVTFGAAVWSAVGPVVVVAGLAGAALLLFREPLSDRALVLWASTATFWFMVLSLVTGQAAITNPASQPPTTWNNRYAASALLSLALLAGYAAHCAARAFPARRVGAVVVAAATLGLAGQVGWWAQDLEGRNFVVAEARAQLRDSGGARAAAAELARVYDGGRVLIDENATSNAIVPLVGLGLDEFILRSSPDFAAALDDPAAYATWLLVQTEADGVYRPRDDVVTAALARPEVRAAYELVLDTGTHQLWKQVSLWPT